MRKILIGAVCAAASGGIASAEVVSASPDHMELVLSDVSELAPDELWKKLIKPSRWWSGDHTYSGDARNLSLVLRAGGLWKEKWKEGAAAHGEVIYFKRGEELRLTAPFGPLQDMAVETAWTITLTPEGEGTRVNFVYRASGSMVSDLHLMATAVDYVYSEALKSLVASDD
ncbi:SRPBCC domain-containing protein [Parvularcula sp. LCG005]|uniref:SRPBCC family protein n=1 Tax=Parvularcula sp. LCG005 TaxID=3078805 RepID=UPI0029435FEC|nr:SRPBCC domain-containing protein [Parvularcula sp. LCG005]WOI54623.1 SRPBCC domain-containing protein [Parvularcula sp. LCG005]